MMNKRRLSKCRDDRPILQVGSYDGEATCAAMVLRCLGRFATPEELAAELTYSRNQTDFDAIIECLASHHVEARPFAGSSPEDFAGSAPALVAHAGRMFVALRRDGDAVAFNDPMEGRIQLTSEQLAAIGPLPCVSFTVGEGFEVRRRPSMWSLIKPYLPKVAIGQLVALTLLVQVIVLTIASTLGRLVDAVLSDDARSRLIVFAVVIGVTAAGQVALRIARAFKLENVRHDLELKLADSFVAGLQSEGVGLMRKGTLGDYTERLQSLSMFQNIISSTLVSLIADGLIGTVFLIALVLISPPLVAISLLMAAVTTTVAFYIASRQLGIMEQGAVQQGRATSGFVELVSSADAATIMGFRHNMRSRWFHATKEAANSDRRVNRLGAVSDATGHTIATITQLVLFISIWLLVQPNPDDVGQWLSTVALAGVAVSQLIGVGGVLGQLGSARPMLWRVRGSLEAFSPDIDDQQVDHDSRGQTFSAVTASDVAVSADGGRNVLFEGAQFECAQGEIVGINGPSGCGKSTFLLGLASGSGICHGTIAYTYADGHAERIRDPRHLTGRLGFVPQAAVVHNMALSDYVRSGREHLSDTDLRDACALAGLDAQEFGLDDILTLQLGELGSHVSGGQRQRIAIARALANKPDVLFLDEATNTIGESQERKLIDRLRQSGVTIILVSHRSSTLELCDRLYRIEPHGLVAASRAEALDRVVADVEAMSPLEQYVSGLYVDTPPDGTGDNLVGTGPQPTSF